MSRRRRAPLTASAPNHDRWLVSYADFITLLFAFFTTLYAISVIDQEKGKRLVHSIRESFGARLLSIGDADATLFYSDIEAPFRLGDQPGGAGSTTEKAQMAVLRERVEDLTDSKTLEQGISVRQTEEGLVISLAETLSFADGGAGVSEQAAEALGSIAEMLRKLPNHIRVEGHTDDRPIRGATPGSNWHLSAYRAAEIVQVLERSGIPGYRLSVAGFAAQRPLLSNRTREGRTQNRRVDIVILRTQLAGNDS